MQEYHVAQLRANALKVLTHRYLLRDPNGMLPKLLKGFRKGCKHHCTSRADMDIHEPFIDYLKQYDLCSPEVLEEVMQKGSVQQVASLPSAVKRLFRSAHEIAPEWHLNHQVTFQQYTDYAVSKTINLPESATVKDVDTIYKNAWKQKAKGITIFRDHSKSSQVLHAGITADSKACKVCAE